LSDFFTDYIWEWEIAGHYRVGLLTLCRAGPPGVLEWEPAPEHGIRAVPARAQCITGRVVLGPGQIHVLSGYLAIYTWRHVIVAVRATSATSLSPPDSKKNSHIGDETFSSRFPIALPLH
jgi:hypothetical protein